METEKVTLLSSHLLKPGEILQSLDLSGYIKLSKLLSLDDEVIVCWDTHCHPVRFKEPFRAIVDGISDMNNLMVLTAKSERTTGDGTKYPPGKMNYWQDLMWHTYKVIQSKANKVTTEANPEQGTAPRVMQYEKWTGYLEWTQETPTKEGFYWYSENNKWSNVFIVRVNGLVTVDHQVSLCMFRHGKGDDEELPVDSWWLGPLSYPPQPPKLKAKEPIQ